MQINKYSSSPDFVNRALCWGDGDQKGNTTVTKNVHSRKLAIPN